VASLGAAASPRFYGGGSVGKLVRSSNPSLRAVVFGAYGQVGRGVVSLLAGNGVQCVVPWRGDDMEWRHLKVMGDIGVVAPMPFSPRDEASIDRAMEGCDIVVNLIGKDFETKHYVPNLVNFSYEEVHVTLAERLARKAVQHGASTFVHVSALAADPFALSAWARSKARGEEAVRAAAPGATIIRPADVFGPEDRFLNLFARMYSLFPRVVLVNEGSARVQPLFVHDLAQAIFKVAMSEDPEVMLGQTYDLAGPEEYTYREVVEYVFESIRADRPEVANVSPAVADAIGFVNGLMPQWIRNPLVTRDTFLRMQADVVLDDRELAGLLALLRVLRNGAPRALCARRVRAARARGCCLAPPLSVVPRCAGC